jgi:hypothetical protein
MQRVNIYKAGPGRDTDGGVEYPYPSLPSYANVPCTAQPVSSEEVEDAGRITKIVTWKMIFGSFLGLSPRDQLVWQDPAGTAHTAFAKADRDEAGRGAAFTVFAEERV